MCRAGGGTQDAGTETNGRYGMTLEAKNLDTPDQKRSTEHGSMNVVTVAGATIVRAVYNPGWRWSTDVKPAVGTDSCQVPHTSYVISGRFGVRMDDGTEGEYGAGDAVVVGPGHDAWVTGDEPSVLIDFAPPAAGGQRAQCPCGVEFGVPDASGLDHLIAAVQQHASGSHGQEVSREHILAELTSG
jgi:hypothetical protein